MRRPRNRTPEQVVAMRKDYNDGVIAVLEILKKYKISSDKFYQIVKGERER